MQNKAEAAMCEEVLTHEDTTDRGKNRERVRLGLEKDERIRRLTL